GPWYYEMQELGFNFRIPDINCALARSQLRKLDAFLERRREIAARYHEELEGLPYLSLPAPAEVEESAWHIYGVHIDFPALGKSRRRVTAELAERGVGTQVHYYPVPLQPYYRHRFGFRPGEFPAAERHYEKTLTIPLFPAMTDGEVGRVIEALAEALR
ncbi:MAG: DegT/DnrJ/EryC1/StrS family aminotransferase, partial [Planctomycetota bacterium]